MSDHTIMIIWVVKIFFVQFFRVFLPPLQDERMKQKQKQYTVVDVTGDGRKVRCCKEQYCIGTWNVRSMNQGKLEVVKRMARMHNNILGISAVKWTETSTLNSDEHYIY